MSKLKPCPECKSTEVALTDEDMLNVNAFCIDCGYMGESFDAVTPTREEADETAIAAWNAISRTDYKGSCARTGDGVMGIQI
jgi:Zn ribbon nucleic-acid-binding protein